jgi:hypothetical protein
MLSASSVFGWISANTPWTLRHGLAMGEAGRFERIARRSIKRRSDECGPSIAVGQLGCDVLVRAGENVDAPPIRKLDGSQPHKLKVRTASFADAAVARDPSAALDTTARLCPGYFVSWLPPARGLLLSPVPHR